MVCVLVNTESEEVEGDDIVKLIILMDPGQYRNIEQLIKDETQVIFYANHCLGFGTSGLIFLYSFVECRLVFRYKNKIFSTLVNWIFKYSEGERPNAAF